MARRPARLPPALASEAFTRREAVAAGVHPSRLRASDLTSVHHGLYVPVTDPPDPGRRPGVWTPAELRAYQRCFPHVVVCGPTAAALHGLVVPDRLRRPHPVHLHVGAGGGRPERPGLCPHRVEVPAGHRTIVQGLTVTTAPRTLWDLCAMDLGMTEREIVVAGDALLAPPWVPGVGRVDPPHTPEELERVLDERGRFVGRPRARTALRRMRVGADSPQETVLRLALVDAGLPEPEVQARLDPLDRLAPVADLVYRRWRLVLQYEGKHHRSREQQERDVRRDRWCADRGWSSLKVIAADAVNDFAGVAARVRRHAADVEGGRR